MTTPFVVTGTVGMFCTPVGPTNGSTIATPPFPSTTT